ncbi:MAG: hypothetical protein LRZ93_05615, partial [Clostridiales bacterium]|nr:hypothetical protein [Clostridiales bacterium]
LNLSISPSEIDVNVHPSKTEIKFKDENEVYSFVSNSISEIIEQNDAIPKLFCNTNHGFSKFDSTNKNTDLIEFAKQSTKSLKSRVPISISKPVNISKAEKQKNMIKTSSSFISDETFNIIIGKNSSNDQLPMNITEVAEVSNASTYNTADSTYNNETEVKSVNNQTQLNFISNILRNYKFIGQLFNTYIIIESESSMYLIDQHAAHERLIYNQLLLKFKSNRNIDSQILLDPEIIDLPSEDFILLIDNIESFNKLGFNIGEFGQNTIIIKETPLILGKPRNFEFIFDLLDEIKDKRNTNQHFSELLIQKACKSAIKANDKLSMLEVKSLLKELSTLKPPLTCPHGRPIVVSMSKYELEKHFKRV